MSDEKIVKKFQVLQQKFKIDVLATDTIAAANAAAANANAAAEAANAAAGRSPYIDDTTGTWWVWDATEEDYVDTETSADPQTAKADKADFDNLVNEVADIEENPSDFARVADFESMPKLAGQPMLLFCNGTPSSSNKPTNWIDFMQGGYEWTGLPSAIGQQLLDYTNHVLYFGWLNPSNYQLEWKH